jgi:hypothetical protein
MMIGNSGRRLTFKPGRKTDFPVREIRASLAQFDLNDDPGFEKIVVSVMTDPMTDPMDDHCPGVARRWMRIDPNTGGEFLPYEPKQQFENQTDDQERQPKHRNTSTNKTPNQKQYARCKGAVRDQISPL